MTSFDKLTEVRDVARARAREDFEFFSNYVLGLSLPTGLCAELQRQFEAKEDLCIRHESERVIRKAATAFGSWLIILGEQEGLIVESTETFDWLFADIARAA